MDIPETNTPERLGKFEIKRRLGRGATSHVFQAFDPFRDHDVAIKVLDPSVFEESESDNMAKTGFMVEASLVGKLDHPHIARIFDVVAEAKNHYVVMEYVDGGTLEKYCQPGSLMDVDSAVDVIFKCGKALEYVSQIGLVHRDIKPANILLAGDTDVKLTDFGAAQSRNVSSSHHIKVGSPYFMSPEQIEDGAIDFRSDIYSLAVVLYQLLTGKRVFEASSMGGLLKMISSIPPDPPSRYVPGLPKRLDEVVMRALEKRPGDRHASWGKFLEELGATHLADGQTVSSKARPTASRPCAAASSSSRSPTRRSGKCSKWPSSARSPKAMSSSAKATSGTSSSSCSRAASASRARAASSTSSPRAPASASSPTCSKARFRAAPPVSRWKTA
jgi:serine/threonine protein kinase